MSLPIFKDTNTPFQLMQSSWKSQLDPLLASSIANASLLKNIQLQSGVNVVNHLLGKTPQGWFVTDVNTAVTIFRSQPFNDLTLTLSCSGAAVVNLAIY